MRSALIAFTVVCVLPTCAQEKPAKFAEFHDYGDVITAEGVWRADNLTDATEIAADTITRIECYRHGGGQLTNTEAYCMQATSSITLGLPSIQVEYLPVITWDKDRIIAADSSTANFPICIWTQLTINRRDHSIMATDTRKLGKGHEGINNACGEVPLAQTYHLVDTIQEFTRRQLRAQRKKSGNQ